LQRILVGYTNKHVVIRTEQFFKCHHRHFIVYSEDTLKPFASESRCCRILVASRVKATLKFNMII